MERISKNRKVCRKPPNYAGSRICAWKRARTVWEGADEKGPAMVPRQLPTSFGGGSQKPGRETAEGAGSPPNTTYIWIQEGWLYLAVVLDLFSRMVVGWSMAALQDATLVVTALEMALVRRRPQAGLLHHSDRGSTSTSESYLALLQQNAMTVSMSRTANCSDNAVTEAFASLASKMNVVIRSPFSPVLRLVIAPLSIWKLFIIELVDIPPYST